LALARQRLLTANYDYYDLADEKRGPAGGFVYKRRQNQKGEEVGGIVPHITLGSIANDEPPIEEVLVDRPEVRKGVVRVTGPFTVEATVSFRQACMNPPSDLCKVMSRSQMTRRNGSWRVTMDRWWRPGSRVFVVGSRSGVRHG
jgi:hypothetical protein